MKFFIISLLTLVGSCATTRHSEKVDSLRNSIVYDDSNAVKKYLGTIKVEELKEHVYEIASEKYMGRLTGKPEHDSLCDYLRKHYKSINLLAPEQYPDYFQKVPKSEFPEGYNDNDSQNVIAFIRGSEFPDEYVYVLAHSDHEGAINDVIYYGADDNASGTAAVLEIAEAFTIAKENGNGPKRSIVFLNVTAEELGLHGSRFYTENPAFPLENTVAVLNTDMIGRVDPMHVNNENYVYLIGVDRVSTELNFITQKANSEFTNLQIDYTFNDPQDSNKYYYRSDHYNFAAQGIPVVFFFSGEHEDYSKSSDTPDKINYELLKRRTDLVFATAWYVANSENSLSREIL